MFQEKCEYLGVGLGRNRRSAIGVDEDEQQDLVRSHVLEFNPRLASRGARARGRSVEIHCSG